ncbi:MAG TPA: VOC family protein [Methylophilaceae bacterium]|nr:VOC family protein [Methylophilaceae bacterium]
MKLKITPCLWFDQQAEQAARFYTSIFPDSRIVHTTHYGEAGHEIHGKPAGSVLTVVFELAGQPFTALNGGPLFKFSEAVSLQVFCDTQAEIDHYWQRLGEGGDPAAQQCGWLKDQFGLSWQIVPAQLSEMFACGDRAKTERLMAALLGMHKLDIARLQQAYQG